MNLVLSCCLALLCLQNVFNVRIIRKKLPPATNNVILNLLNQLTPYLTQGQVDKENQSCF